MVNVAVAELKASLSKFLARVRAGEEVVVTDRGRPVARLTRLAEASPDVDRLVRKGVLRPADEPLDADEILRAELPSDPKRRVLRALLEERDSAR